MAVTEKDFPTADLLSQSSSLSKSRLAWNVAATPSWLWVFRAVFRGLGPRHLTVPKTALRKMRVARTSDDQSIVGLHAILKRH